MADREELNEDASSAPLQFSLRSLFIVQAAWAFLLGLATISGLLAVLAIHIATWIYAILPLTPRHDAKRRGIVFFSMGIVLPILVWLGSIEVSSAWLSSQTQVRLGWMLAVQMAALAIWFVFGDDLGKFRSVISGVLFCGIFIAGYWGILLLPFTVTRLWFFGVGLLGLAPFYMANVLACAAVEARPYQQIRMDGGAELLWWAGFALAWLMPMLFA
jgi:hypothetical protein